MPRLDDTSNFSPSSAGAPADRKDSMTLLDLHPHSPLATFADWAADPTVVFLKTSTTGLRSDAEPVEIALVDAREQVLFYTRVRPTLPVPPQASAIHGLTDLDLVDAPLVTGVWAAFSAALEGKRVVAYNADYDARVLRQGLSLAGGDVASYGFPEALRDRECAMEAYALVAGELNSQGNPKSLPFKNVLEREDVEPTFPFEHHASVAVRTACDLARLVRAVAARAPQETR